MHRSSRVWHNARLLALTCVTRMPFSRVRARHPPISRSTPANVQLKAPLAHPGEPQLNPLALKTIKSHTRYISVQKDVDCPHYCRLQPWIYRWASNSSYVTVPPSWTTSASEETELMQITKAVFEKIAQVEVVDDAYRLVSYSPVGSAQ